MAKALLLCVLATCIGIPKATAQPQQTPENAQRFLAAALPERFLLQFESAPPVNAVRISQVQTENNHCGTRFNYHLEGVSAQRGMPLNWSQVASVMQQAEAITLQLTAQYRLYFNFPSRDLATRATFVMEFLRQHCDPLADTGF